MKGDWARRGVVLSRARYQSEHGGLLCPPHDGLCELVRECEDTPLVSMLPRGAVVRVECNSPCSSNGLSDRIDRMVSVDKGLETDGNLLQPSHGESGVILEGLRVTRVDKILLMQLGRGVIPVNGRT